jgi:hypothetical protein
METARSLPRGVASSARIRCCGAGDALLDAVRRCSRTGTVRARGAVGHDAPSRGDRAGNGPAHPTCRGVSVLSISWQAQA